MSEKRAKYGSAPATARVRFNLDTVLDIASRSAGYQITKAAAAKRIGITEKALYSMLKQPSAIRLETLKKICLAFDTTPGKLLTLEDA